MSSANEESLDDLIDEWHENPRGMELHEYLGMTKEQYAEWLKNPDKVPA